MSIVLKFKRQVEGHRITSSGNRTICLSFFLPCPKSVTSTNVRECPSSPEWTAIYIETNELIKKLSLHLEEVFADAGEEVVTIPATHNWVEQKLISNWSHRHVAFIAGLGRFGLNDMLIIEKGCCGRIRSFFTSAVIGPDVRLEDEHCLYKYDGSVKKMRW